MRKKNFSVVALTAVNLLMVSFVYCQDDLRVIPGMKEACTVKYIGNDGYLIRMKIKKVLKDAFFGDIKGNWCDQSGDSISNLIEKINNQIDKNHEKSNFLTPPACSFLVVQRTGNP